MYDLSFLPVAAQRRWQASCKAMGTLGLGHLARLQGQLEGYALLLVDLEQISAEQAQHLQDEADELFVQWRTHYLNRSQKSKTRTSNRPVGRPLVNENTQNHSPKK